MAAVTTGTGTAAIDFLVRVLIAEWYRWRACSPNKSTVATGNWHIGHSCWARFRRRGSDSRREGLWLACVPFVPHDRHRSRSHPIGRLNWRCSNRRTTPVIGRLIGAWGAAASRWVSLNPQGFDAVWTAHQAEAGCAAFSPGALAFVSLAREPAAEFWTVGTADFRGFDEPLAGFSSPQSGDSTTSVQTMSPANWRLTHSFMRGQPLQL